MKYLKKNWLVVTAVVAVAIGTLMLVIGISASNQNNQASAHVLNSPTMVTTLSPVAVAQPVKPLTPAQKVAKQIGCGNVVGSTKSEMQTLSTGSSAGIISDYATCSMNGTKYIVLVFTGTSTKALAEFGFAEAGLNDPAYSGPTWDVYTKAQWAKAQKAAA